MSRRSGRCRSRWTPLRGCSTVRSPRAARSIRSDAVSKFGLEQLPSEYIGKHFHFGYMTDTFGLRNLEYMGAERVLWSSDYPHISADWPSSWRVIQSSMSGISLDDRQLILAGNAQRLYKFGQ